MSALWFSILLNLKHIFAYVAPAYVVYLLGSYCLQGNFDLSKTAKRISKLVLIGFITCAVSFGPFIRQISQVSTMKRLANLFLLMTNIIMIIRLWRDYFHLNVDYAMHIGPQIFGQFIM